MSTALKHLFNELIKLHLVFKRRVKDIVDAVLLIQFNIVTMLYLSLRYLVFGNATKDSSDTYVIEGLYIFFTVWVVA
jgi:hypothetical protein